jgi:hypothetical protein
LSKTKKWPNAIPYFFVSINYTPNAIKTLVKSVIEKGKKINKGKQNNINKGLNTNSAYVLSHLV